MTNAQALLNKIATLRHSPEPLPGFGRPARPDEAPGDGARVQKLERQVREGQRQLALLDGTLRQLSDGAADAPLPARLTGRARRLLEGARELLHRLRTLAEPLAAVAGRRPPAEPTAASETGDPLADLFREAVAMTDTVLRTVQAFPDAPSAQFQLCEGLEAVLVVIAERTATLRSAVEHRLREQDRLDTFAAHLQHLEAGRPVTVKDFLALAEELLAEARQALPLRFLETGLGEGMADSVIPESCSPADAARFVAAHSLNVARVVARLVQHESGSYSRPLDPILAALLHDVGMLRVPALTLARPGPLDDAERRAVEAHAVAGAELAARLYPSATWLAEVVAGHHERLDGTGYPAGLRENQLTPLTRLLAVCDVYAALCVPRPHRPARDTRTALADVLLQVEQGALDREHAGRLLVLSFYPVGTVVELADGAVGVVVATHMGRRNATTPARPVLALLTDSQRQPLPEPRHLDLGEVEGRGITRTLSAAERREAIGRRHPGLV